MLEGAPTTSTATSRWPPSEAGPVLELAAGTGRLAIPLALAGHQVTAVDIDPAMLARAQGRLGTIQATAAAPGGSLELSRETSWTSISMPASHSSSSPSTASSCWPHASARQRAAWRPARHLRPGGLAVVDVWLPRPDDLELYDGRLILEWQRDGP